MLYTETTMAMENPMPMQNTRTNNTVSNNNTPNTTTNNMTGNMSDTSVMQSGNCSTMEGSLPGKCGNMVFPYVAMQGENARRYDKKEALQNGTLFPGLNLPFHKDLKTRFPAVNTALSELMALDFAIDELGLYLNTHSDDLDALNLYWTYIKLANEGRKKYETAYGPLLQTTLTPGEYKWLKDPWPWEKGGND